MWLGAEGGPEIEDTRQPRAGQRRMSHRDGRRMATEGRAGRGHHRWRAPRDEGAAGEQVRLVTEKRLAAGDGDNPAAKG